MSRTLRFVPYRKGMGPTFTLIVSDGGVRSDSKFRGFERQHVAYELRMKPVGRRSVVLFQGDDFSTPYGVDPESDEAVCGLMGFLTLKPGDTDDEYFEKYNSTQLAYAEEYAESLSLEVMNRVGEC